MTKSSWTTTDMPDLAGRTAVVTGANTGLGLETAAELAAHGAHVVLAVRNTDKGQAALATIRSRHPNATVAMQALDLSDLSSIRTAATELLAANERLDLLINNAGVMYTPESTTADGFEMQMGTNHLGHFALTGLLLARLLDTPGSRVVTVSSVGHKFRSAIDVDHLATTDNYDRVAAYGRSKLANLLFTYELQRRLSTADAGTVALAAHPGLSDTELARNSPKIVQWGSILFRPLTQSAAKGALPTLRAAVDPTAHGGEYFGPDGIGEARGNPKVVESNSRSHETDLQRRLWEKSLELTAVTFPI